MSNIPTGSAAVEWARAYLLREQIRRAMLLHRAMSPVPLPDGVGDFHRETAIALDAALRVIELGCPTPQGFDRVVDAREVMAAAQPGMAAFWLSFLDGDAPPEDTAVAPDTVPVRIVVDVNRDGVVTFIGDEERAARCRVLNNERRSIVIAYRPKPPPPAVVVGTTEEP